MLCYVEATWKVLQFYSKYVWQFGRIHEHFYSGLLFVRLYTETVEGAEARFDLNGQFARDFNADFGRLEAQMRQLLPPCRFEPLLVKSLLVRLLWIVALVRFGPWALPVGLLQFAVAPMSFVCCLLNCFSNLGGALTHWVVTFLSVLVAKAIVGAAAICGRLVAPTAWQVRPVVELNLQFVLAFLAIDLLASLLLYVASAEKVGLACFCKHLVFGFLNGTTTLIVVFAALAGIQIDVAVWVVSGALAFKLPHAVPWVHYLLSQPHAAILYYCEHRLQHLPVVYTHSHKMHHYLHDTLPFDASKTNSMNEAFFWILLETLPCLLAPNLLYPTTLLPAAWYGDWLEKANHTRTAEDRKGFEQQDSDNFHADHHILHTANFSFGYSACLDFYFGTEGRHTRGIDGKVYSLGPAEEKSKGAEEDKRDALVLRVHPLREGSRLNDNYVRATKCHGNALKTSGRGS